MKVVFSWSPATHRVISPLHLRNGSGWVALVLMVLMSGCGKVSDRSNVDDVDSRVLTDNGPADQDSGKPGLSVLFLGNSHTYFNDVPGLVEQLIESGGKHQVTTRLMSGAFLETLASRDDVQAAIKTGDWDVVVMQGHKISGSGRFIYSTDAPEELSKLSNDSGAKVVWYSEWGRRGVKGESERTQKIYQQMSDVNNDTLAPVGEVWKAAFAKRPKIALHQKDGNHANAQGSFLAALTLSVAITGDDCATWPAIELKEIDADTQSFFKTIVSGVPQHLSADEELPKQEEATNARQFDFWIGQWDVFDIQGKQVGTNTIESVLKGRALHEQWQSASGSKGFSYNIYSDGRWHQTWVDDGGRLLLLDGEFSDGRMVLKGETRQNGKVIFNRISWELLEDGRVKQHWETSTDDGKTWSDAFLGFYVRKSAPEANGK